MVISKRAKKRIKATKLLNQGANMSRVFGLITRIIFALIIFTTISMTYKALSSTPHNDSTPPTVLSLRISKPEPPITPWDTVVIETQVVDVESGVDNVTLLYGVGENPTNLVYTSVFMYLTFGDCYNGTYEGEIPPQENGTLVWYYVSAIDKAGNSYETHFMDYFVYLPRSYLTIIIGVENIDMNDLSASLNVIVSGYLPSPFESPKLILHASNGYMESLADFDIFTINMSTSLRFWYQETIKWKVHLIGNPNDYPFDRYFLRLNFTIWWGQIGRIEGKNVYYTHGRLLNAWQEPAWKSESYSGTYPQIIFDIPFVRSQYSTEPFWIIIFSMCLLIGGSLLISPQKLEHRISIYLTTFIFIIGFLFQIKDSLPFHIGYTKAELILLYLAIINCVYIITSIITSEFKKNGPLIAITINLFSIFVLGYRFNLLAFPTLPSMAIIIVFLLYGEAIHMLLQPKTKQMIRKILRKSES